MTRESYFDGQAVRYDIVDLRLFIHVAESNSLSRGAERSNLSASAASIRIKNLEQNLGVQLLKRTGRGVDLTGPGETFLRHARVVIRELENMHAELREHVKGVRGQVKVGANVSGLSGLLPQAMRRYLVSHADVEVDLREYSSEDAISALIEGDIDIALVSWVKQREGLEIFPLHAERSVLIVSPAHPLATNPSTTFAQALDYDFIGLGAGAHSHRKYARTAKRLDKTLSVRIHVRNIEDLCGMVSDNVGVAIVREAVAAKYADEMGFVVVGLEDGWARRQTSLCIRTPRTLPRFAYELLDVILETAGDLEKKGEAIPAI